MADTPQKGDQAFRTIGELADELGVPQHILRYWESRFPQLRPLQRAGNRRYYRPADVALAYRIHQLLNQDGYTIRGVQQLLAAKGTAPDAAPPAEPPAANAPSEPPAVVTRPGVSVAALRDLRDHLANALQDSSF